MLNNTQNLSVLISQDLHRHSGYTESLASLRNQFLLSARRGVGGHKVKCKVRVVQVHESILSSLMHKDRMAHGKRHLTGKDTRFTMASIQETLEEQIEAKVADQGQANEYALVKDKPSSPAMQQFFSKC